MLGLGLAAGLTAVLAGGRVVESLLFNVGSADPATIAGAIGLLGGVALLAGYFPARHASRIQPTSALRIE